MLISNILIRHIFLIIFLRILLKYCLFLLAGAPPDNCVSSSPATHAIPHDGLPNMTTGNLQSIIRVSNTTMPQHPSPANQIQRNGAGLLTVATSNYQSTIGSSAITISHRLSQQIRLTAYDIDISRIVCLEYDPAEPDIPRGSNTPVLDEKHEHGQIASPSLLALPQMISPLQTRAYQPHTSHTSAAPAAAGAPPDNCVSSSPATQAIPHDGLPNMTTGNLQSIIRVSNTTMPQPPSPANQIQRNGAGLLTVATSNYQSTIGSSAITISHAPSPATLTTQSNDGTLHNSE